MLLIKGLKDNKRHPIPRWRDYKTTLILGELDSPCKVGEKNTTKFDEEIMRNNNKWEYDKSLPNAIELVQTAIVTNRQGIAKNAAEFIIKQKGKVSFSLLDKACLLVGHNIDKDKTCISDTFSLKQLYNRINTLKNATKLYPYNAIYWIDLALLYTNLGQMNKAEDCIVIANTIAPNNRFILRSANRFFFHKNDYDKALYYLRRSELIKEDPWIMAAEIASSSAINKTSGLIKRANQTIENKNFSPHSLSELSSAIGTIEYESGKIKTAKKYIRKSLESPSDNSLAQAFFLSNDLTGISEDLSEVEKSPCSYEADAFYNYQNGNWEEALNDCLYWFQDIPFSSWSTVLGSYIAAELLEDYSQSRDFSEMGLISNPDDYTLLNNLIFAELNLNNIEKAEELLLKIKINELKAEDKIGMFATIGLLSFRKNDIEKGREYYEKAISLCRSNDSLYRAAAYTHLAYEERRQGIQDWKDNYMKAKNIIEKHNDIVMNKMFSNKFGDVEAPIQL